MAERHLHFKNAKPLLDNHHEFAYLAITATCQLLIEPSGDPEDAQPLRNLDRVCEPALFSNKCANCQLCL